MVISRPTTIGGAGSGVRDHFTSTNLSDKDMLYLVEGEKSMIPWATLATLKVASLPKLDWQWITGQLWTFTSRFMSDTVFGQWVTHTGVGKLKRLDLGRALYMENMRGSIEIQFAERN